MIYTPPAASSSFFEGLDFATAGPVATEFCALVNAADTGSAHADPSRIATHDERGRTALLRFPNGAIFWDCKLAVDADGVKGTSLDPEDGQDDTSWHFGDRSPLDARVHPFYVLPLGAFGAVTGLRLGDVGVCVYRNQITGFLFGDEGPHSKLGEASIAVHDGLRPAAPDCCRRDADGNPTRIIDVSIEHSVLVLAFPRSAIEGLTPDNLAEAVKARAYALLAAMKPADGNASA